MHYYQHHIGDFIRDTARLSDSQCMAYLRMIWHYYETEQPLKNDTDALAFRFGANASDVHQILKHYFFLHEGRWHNSRCDKEILSFRSKSEKAKESANARWENAKAMRTHSERNANEPLLDANQEPITNISNADALDSGTRTKTAQGTRLPTDAVLATEWLDEAFKIHPEWNSAKATAVFAEFKDYWIAQAGAKGRKADWLATWRNWCRREKGFSKSAPQTTGDRRAAVTDQIWNRGGNGNGQQGQIVDVTPDGSDSGGGAALPAPKPGLR